MTDGPLARGDGERGPATAVTRLATLLGRADLGGGEPLTPIELAEVLWLAQHIRPLEPPGSVPHAEHPAAVVPETAVPPERKDQAERPRSDSGTGPSRPPPSATPPRSSRSTEDRVPLHLPDPPRTPAARTGTHTPLLAPAPPLLSHPLSLQRALRPLKRRVPAPVGLELDEKATAHLIARLGAPPQWWLPVLRPVAERWLTLHIVYDAGPTMPVWSPLIRELHTAVAQSGVFRTVELNRLAADGTLCGSGSPYAYADGRTVTLLISDCMGPQWRGGPAGSLWYRTLRRWCARMPVAVIQPLPERLWRTTALPAETARIGGPWPAAPNSSYDMESYVLESAEPGALPVPVLEASAPWLANWSRLLAHPRRVPGSVALLGTSPPPSPVDDHGRGDVERLSPEELLLRFRSLASPEAFRLAGHLAVGRPRLPVMRLVQAAIERDPRPQHLAEVILSGMLRSVPGPPGSYAFRPGMRSVLLRTLPRSARHLTAELLTRMGELIDERAGLAPGSFRVAAPGGTGATAAGVPFAEVREESVRRLGGTVPKDPRLVLGVYRMVRELWHGSGVWQAEDTRSGRTVALYRYDVGPEQHETFLDRARALADVRHPNVVGVHVFGLWDGSAWLVTEFVEGVTLAELTAEGGFRLPYWMLTAVANQVARCLTVVHGHGLAHGRLTPNCLLLCPDGTVKVTRFALERTRPDSESRDLDDLGHLLSALLGGSATAEHQVPADTELPRSRRAFREPFADAVEDLRSAGLDRQRRGRDRFTSLTFDKHTAAAGDPYGYRLLGPVRITRDDRPLPVLPPQEQALLCMLLLRSGRTVTHRELAEGLWGERLPDHADRELAGHASRLRHTLGDGILATTSGGYALYATPRTIDVNQCEELAARAGFRREDGETATARDLVQYALDLWRGEPLDGVPGPAAEAARIRLRALRLDLCATRGELDLENGDFAQASTDLAALLRSHPARADFRRLHLLALRGQGRVDEAIESYEAYRAHRRHGEPAPALDALHRELLDARAPGRTVISLEIAPPAPHPQILRDLDRALPPLLSLSGLTPDQYEILGRANGCLIRAEPDASLRSLLAALDPVLRRLPHDLGRPTVPAAVRVMCGQALATDTPAVPPDVRAALDHIPGNVVIVVAPGLHRELTAGGPPADTARYQPLHGEGPDAPPLAWYRVLETPEPDS